MKKKKLPIFPFLLLPLLPLFLCAGGLALCYRVGGFQLLNISSALAYNENWSTEPLTLSEHTQLVEKVFPQAYTYLASGPHCYAFISEDRRYVLKFFKAKYHFPKHWLSPLAFLRRSTGTQFFSERILASYKDAYEYLRIESGLIYTHLNKTREFNTKVCLIDNKGKRHVVDLDEVEFVVQKKAVKIFERLNELAQEGDLQGLRAAIHSFLQLIALRCEKGFTSHDFTIKKNFGFVGTQAIQINCSSLVRDSSMRYPMNFREEVLQAAKRLDHWAFEHCPELTFFIQNEAQRIIQEAF